LQKKSFITLVHPQKLQKITTVIHLYYGGDYMVIPFLIFVGMCAVFMVGVGICFLMAVLGAIAKLISVVAHIDEDSALRVTVVLLGIVLTTLSIMSRV
jgi:hypothetical protein